MAGGGVGGWQGVQRGVSRGGLRLDASANSDYKE